MGTCCSRINSQDELNLKRKQPIIIEADKLQGYEKSALKIQSQFRSQMARKQVRFEKTILLQDMPTSDIAKPAGREPDMINPLVKNTLNQLGEYIFQQMDPEDCIQYRTLEPYEFENGAIYVGSWYKKQRHGRGKQYWPDGSFYDGQWKDHNANGNGRLIHADGDAYQGRWLDDKAHGVGTYYHTDGAKYEGEWYEDQQHGNGKETWPDGACYEGNYVMGKKEKQGHFLWSDGAVYCGEFNDNNIEGLEGDWVSIFGLMGGSTMGNGSRIRCMVRVSSLGLTIKYIKVQIEGCVYQHIGGYVDDKKEGYGEFSWPDGRKYLGQWKDGKQFGQGINIDKHGKEIISDGRLK